MRAIEMRIEELHDLVQKLKEPRERRDDLAADLLGQVKHLTSREATHA